jgi:hypothetical protein
VVETVGDEVLANLMPFISNTIANQDNLYKQASLMAFSALVVGTTENIIRPILMNSFLTVLQLIQEDNFVTLFIFLFYILGNQEMDLHLLVQNC